MNLATRLVEAAHAHGDRPAVRLDDTVLTYAELLSRASDVAAELVGQGFQPGDRAGLLLPNAPAYPVHFYGILLAGGIVVPMNPLLRHRRSSTTCATAARATSSPRPRPRTRLARRPPRRGRRSRRSTSSRRPHPLPPRSRPWSGQRATPR